VVKYFFFETPTQFRHNARGCVGFSDGDRYAAFQSKSIRSVVQHYLGGFRTEHWTQGSLASHQPISMPGR